MKLNMTICTKLHQKPKNPQFELLRFLLDFYNLGFLKLIFKPWRKAMSRRKFSSGRHDTMSAITTRR